MPIAIIPARGGSKRIPRKNIKLFQGKPIIAWSILSAKNSGVFDRIVVSTDDNEIRDIALEWGADVPFIRPKKLSDDFTGTLEVISHAIKELDLCEKSSDHICCIYPASPLTAAKDLVESYRILLDTNASYVVPVCKNEYPVERALIIERHNRLGMLFPDKFNFRTQDLVQTYQDAGQFYWGKRDAWLSNLSFFTSLSTPYILPRERVQDIDTLSDWHMAEIKFNFL
jgi:pseudaminic acid cytidylyltransferase